MQAVGHGEVGLECILLCLYARWGQSGGGRVYAVRVMKCHIVFDIALRYALCSSATKGEDAQKNRC